MWYVTYRNEGKPERSPSYETKAKAQEVAAFLRFQKATAVRIKQGQRNPYAPFSPHASALPTGSPRYPSASGLPDEIGEVALDRSGERDMRMGPPTPSLNPLRAGYSRAVVSANIRMLMHEGREQEQAVAIALNNARREWQRRHPGQPLPKHLREQTFEVNPPSSASCPSCHKPISNNPGPGVYRCSGCKGEVKIQ